MDQMNVKLIEIEIRNLYVRSTCTLINKLAEISFVEIQGKQTNFEPLI